MNSKNNRIKKAILELERVNSKVSSSALRCQF
jgi:hypothetical protein